ncbi:MAG TPA: DUF86 domain-containing protein [Deltaproteobacteria bacterium]|nr:DUF86 domain-containing protein [Deltaproteobacteria bacterium]HQB39780.1 DUF86 domain-containing protein [Deltaproteobacteria bacterium]
MSDRHSLLYLQDILDSGAAILQYADGISYESFCGERMRYTAVIREFEIIGEAVSKLDMDLKQLDPTVPWQDIKDFRNLLIHEYFGVDLEIVWNTIHNDLPGLLDAVSKLLHKLNQAK